MYDDPLKAVMFNPIHASIVDYNLWECECSDPVADDSLKIGVKRCKTLKIIEPPVITLNQRVRFGILCALKVYHDESFVEWANDWLIGKNRENLRAAEAAEAAEAAGSAAQSGIMLRQTKNTINLLSLIKKAIKDEQELEN